MHEAAVIALASALGAVMDGDTSVPDRTGNRHPALAMAPYNTYPCTDGYVAIFTSAERHWHSMCRLLGRPDLAENPEYASTIARASHMAEIDDIVGAWTITRTKDEVLRLLNEAHVPCAPVKTAREVAHDPHLEARGFWVDIDHPRRGRTRVPISPIRLHTGGKSEIRSPAPTLGQHTEAVLAELLGLKAEELATLRAERRHRAGDGIEPPPHRAEGGWQVRRRRLRHHRISLTPPSTYGRHLVFPAGFEEHDKDVTSARGCRRI